MGGRKGVKGLTTNMCGIVMSEATVSSRELLSKARQNAEMLNTSALSMSPTGGIMYTPEGVQH